jgi:AcrR family transcriptional regulator
VRLQPLQAPNAHVDELIARLGLGATLLARPSRWFCGASPLWETLLTLWNGHSDFPHWGIASSRGAAKFVNKKVSSRGRGLSTKAQAESLSRDRILDVAEMVFATRGYGESKLADIADAFNVTRQALYYYFHNKDEILYALYIRWFERARVALDEAINAADNDPLARFEALFTRYVLLHAQNSAMVATFALERDSLPREQRAHVRSLRREMQQRFVDAYEEAVAAGEFNPNVPADVATALLLGAINWSYRWYNSGRTYSPKELAVMAQELFSSGYQSPPNNGKRRPPKSTANSK